MYAHMHAHAFIYIYMHVHALRIDGAEPYVDGQVALLVRTPQCKLDYNVS
jgi:hypothetical protein